LAIRAAEEAQSKGEGKQVANAHFGSPSKEKRKKETVFTPTIALHLPPHREEE
jgi:hypothetical protein